MTREEALQAIKAKMDYYEGDKRLRAAMETLIPELRESEDERMLRTIIRGFENWKSHGSVAFNNTKVDDILAYLEKQKEQKPAAEEILAKAGLKPYKDGNQWCILAGDNIQEGICGFGDTIDEALYEFLKEVLTMANSPQLKEQKPAEWSEEDRKMIDHLIEALPMWANGRIAMLPSQADEYVERLKSLRPSWKPSEEQEEPDKSLEEAVEKHINEALFKWSYDDEDGIEQYVHDSFIAGAEWQKQQMLKDAVGGTVHHALNCHYIMTDQQALNDRLREIPEGTKVNIYIRKAKGD